MPEIGSMCFAEKRQRGLSIIELMVALALGLLVIGVIIGIFVTTNRNFTQDELIGRMQENARYAMRVISQDLAMAGFWGPSLEYSGFNTAIRDCTNSPDSSNPEKCGGFWSGSKLNLSAGGDCGPGMASVSQWAYDLSNVTEVIEQATASLATSTFACLNAADFQPQTDVLVIKRVRGAPLASDRADPADNGEVFMRTNGDAGMLLVYDSSAPAPVEAEDWRYLVNVYYVQDHFLVDGDAIPSLYRMTLDGTSIVQEGGAVAQGIEYFHVTFGIDGDGDGIAELYVPQPTAAELRAAVTARIYVLARSAEPHPGYVNDKTYQLGDVAVDFSGTPDEFYRRVFMTTAQIRNNVNRNRFISGS